MRVAPVTVALALVCLVAPVIARADGAEREASTGTFYQLTGAVPAGFEGLVGPQQVLVDVYYGGDFLTSTLAVCEPGTIEFDHPEEVVGKLGDLLAPEPVLNALTGPLPSHAEAVCPPGSRGPGCGVIEPTSAGVIYDGSRYRVDLFVSPALRVLQDPESARYLPPSDAGLSYLQNVNLNAAGSDAGSDLVSLTSMSTVAWHENRLVGIASYTDQDDVTIDGLYGQRDFRGNEYRAGLFRTAGRYSVFAGDFDLVGYQMSTSLATRTDLGIARGTPLEVFLLAPGRVDIIKDGRLLGSATYGAGNHRLDTSSLPEGAYDLTVRINEGGRVREETRFFSKTSRIPPRDQPLRTLELGRVVNVDTNDLWPEDADAWFSRAGYTRRLTDTFGFDAGFTSTENEQLYEAGLFQIDRLPGGFEGYYELQAASFVSDDGDRGFAFNGLVRRGVFSASLNYRKIDQNDPVSATREAQGDFFLVPESRTERTALLRLPLGAGVLSFAASRSKLGEGSSTDSQSVNLRYPLRIGGRASLEVTADLGRQDGDFAALLGLRLNLWRGRWTAEIAPRIQTTEGTSQFSGDGLQVDSFAAYSDRDNRLGDLRASVRAGAGAAEDRLGARFELNNVLGRSDLSVDRVNSDGTTTDSWAASLSTSLLTTGDHWTLGAQNAAQAALVVKLEGSAPGVRFEVLVDGYRRGYAPVGRATAILLAPFQTYDVRIRPVGSAFVAYDDHVQQVTLYPGNVEQVSWDVGRLLVVVGKVVDVSSGTPLSGAELANVHGMAARTDADGYFQAELVDHGGELTLDFRRGEERCVVGLAEYEEVAGVALLDTVGCQPRRVRGPDAPGI
jgi:hypothetical protein